MKKNMNKTDEILEIWTKTPLCKDVPEPFLTILSYNLEDLASNVALNHTIQGVPVTMPLTTRLSAMMKVITLQKGERYLSDDVFKMLSGLKFDDLKDIMKPTMLKSKFEELSKLFSEGKVTVIDLLSEPEKLFNEEDAEYFSVQMTLAVSIYMARNLKGYRLADLSEDAKKIEEKSDLDALKTAIDAGITDGTFASEEEKRSCIHWTKSMLYLNVYMANMEKEVMDELSLYGVLTYEPDVIRIILDKKLPDGGFSEVMETITNLKWDELKEKGIITEELPEEITKNGKMPWQCAEELGYFNEKDGLMSKFREVLEYAVEKYADREEAENGEE